MISKYLPKQRLYKYGKLGLDLHDDRTFAEKVFDWLRKFNEKKYEIKNDSMRFKPFLDISTGKMITSMEEIKEREKNGQMLVKPHEIAENAKRVKAYKREQHSRKIRAGLEQAVREIKQGRSFVREMAPNIKQKVGTFN